MSELFSGMPDDADAAEGRATLDPDTGDADRAGEVAEGDAAEQRRPMAPQGSGPPAHRGALAEADPGDAWEQDQSVEDGDEDYDRG